MFIYFSDDSKHIYLNVSEIKRFEDDGSELHIVTDRCTLKDGVHVSAPYILVGEERTQALLQLGGILVGQEKGYTISEPSSEESQAMAAQIMQMSQALRKTT